MQFALISALALTVPLTSAFYTGYSNNGYELAARGIEDLDLYSLDRRFADEEDFDLSVRSFDDDEILDMILARAYTGTPDEHSGIRLKPIQQINDKSINRVNQKLGEWQAGKGKSTEEKRRQKISHRSLDDEDILDIIARAYTGTPNENSGVRLKPIQQINDKSINRVNQKLGEWQKGKGKSTEEKRNQKISHRSLDDEDILDIIARAYTGTPHENSGVKLKPIQQINDKSINRVNQKLGEWQKGKGKSTEEKRNQKISHRSLDDEDFLDFIFA